MSFLALTEVWALGRALIELLAAYYLCTKANSPSLPQNSVSSFFRKNTIPARTITYINFVWGCNFQICRNSGRLIFIHLQCWEVLPFCRFQRQRCIKILCPKDPDFYTPLALKTAKGQHLPALEVYKNQSPK